MPYSHTSITVEGACTDSRVYVDLAGLLQGVEPTLRTCRSGTMSSNLLTVGLLPLIVLSPFWFAADAAKGLDASVLLYSFDFKDFVEGGSGDFVILQGYYSNGSVNRNAVIDNEEAYGAGYDNFDIYMSPCLRCNKSASQQVQEMGKLNH